MKKYWVLAAATLAALVYLLLRPTDEDRIRGQLAALAAAVRVDGADVDPRARTLRIQKAFGAVLAPGVAVEVPELGAAEIGREDLMMAAVTAGADLRAAELRVAPVVVTLEPSGGAALVTARGQLDATRREGGPWREARALRISFRKVDGEWRITRIASEP